jgi:putative flippase GtrA
MTFRRLADEGIRYFAASALAFALDLATLSGLSRFAGVHYLLSVRWVFAERRVTNPRVEFVLFGLIGLVGMGINELVIYAGVEQFALAPEQAKIPSAALVFCFNFAARKLLLFTRYR